MLHAISLHILAILTFQHSGKGLPKTVPPILLLFCMASLTIAARLSLSPVIPEGEDVMTAYLLSLLGLLVMFAISRHLGSALLLATIGTDLILSSVYALELASSADGFVGLWKVCAVTVIAIRQETVKGKEGK